MTAIMAQSNISFQSEMGLMNSMEPEEGGTFDGGFDINDYVNEQTNPYFLELAHNISLANGGGANHRIRGAGRNELAPIDFAELQRKDAMMMTTTRKFKHVAGLVMFLQAVPILGKYVYYGCYCFSDAQYQLDAGHGKPVDAIDSACKRFHQCYACVKKDFVEEKQQVTDASDICHGNMRKIVDNLLLVTNFNFVTNPLMLRINIERMSPKSNFSNQHTKIVTNIQPL